MNTLQTELSLVKTKFPSHQFIIEDLYRKDNDFKSLCADLFLCSEMIHEFEVEISEKQLALVEYGDIIKELEKELLMLIENADSEK